MKTLFLIRHAKSDWGDNSLSDFERPLNDRGKSDAPKMAHRLLDKKIEIDVFISSPAKRARKTASVFAKELNVDMEDVIYRDELYGAAEDVYYDVIANTDDKYENIAIIAHNPGITDFANQLTDTRVDNIPTCGIFALTVDCKHWSAFRDAAKHFLFFDYPKASV